MGAQLAMDSGSTCRSVSQGINWHSHFSGTNRSSDSWNHSGEQLIWDADKALKPLYDSIKGLVDKVTKFNDFLDKRD